MVKKILKDGSDCRKCAEATEHLQARGLWDKIDEVVWAREDDPESPGMQLGARHGVERAPFFVVRDEKGEKVYTRVLRLIEDRLGQALTSQDQAGTVDPDDVGGI